MRPRHMIMICIAALLCACSSAEKSPLAGKWEATDKHDGQTDKYVFTINEKKPGSFSGTIATSIDGAAMPGTPINRIEYEHPNFRFTVNAGELVITYLGMISEDYTRLLGHFEYSNPAIQPKELTLTRQTKYEPKKVQAQYKKPISTVFPAASLNEVRMDETAIGNLLKKTSQGEFGEINSLLILKDGNLVVEEYYNEFSSDKLHQLQSCTKSVTSILLGIAIDRGLIQSVDDKVLQYLPGMSPASGWENVTIRHLLTMSSGVEWIKEDPKSPWDKDEGTEAILAKPVTGKTGTEFNYNSAMQVLGTVLENASGMDLQEFAEQNLFQTLEIAEYKWQESQADGVPLCTGALQLRPIDLAKIGQLILKKGIHNGQQVVSENWITESTRVQIEVPKNRGDHYGYLWWIGTESEPMVYAHGMGSQFVFIVPRLNLVAVTTGNNLYNGKDLTPFQMLKNSILKSIQQE